MALRLHVELSLGVNAALNQLLEQRFVMLPRYAVRGIAHVAYGLQVAAKWLPRAEGWLRGIDPQVETEVQRIRRARFAARIKPAHDRSPIPSPERIARAKAAFERDMARSSAT